MDKSIYPNHAEALTDLYVKIRRTIFSLDTIRDMQMVNSKYEKQLKEIYDTLGDAYHKCYNLRKMVMEDEHGNH